MSINKWEKKIENNRLTYASMSARVGSNRNAFHIVAITVFDGCFFDIV